MIEAYSLNVTVPTNSAVPFNNVTVQKGCTAIVSAPATIQLNKCGVYMVSCDASSATSTSIQLFKDGIAQAQAQGTGTSPSFITLVQVERDNSNCCCSSPTLLQVRNSNSTSATFTDINLCVTKVC